MSGLTPGTQAYAQEYYKQKYRALRTSPNQIKFFAAVSKLNTNSCRGRYAYVGQQYLNLAASLGGASVDVCSQSVSDTLASIKGNLTVERIGLITRHLPVEQQPDLASIQVIRHIGGNPSNQVEIPKSQINADGSRTDGWEYLGMGTYYRYETAGVNPVHLNNFTGYGIRLNGNAALRGADTAEVVFRPAGNQNASN